MSHAMETRSKRRQRSSDGKWASLPEDLLLPILMKLNLVDYSSFSRVCSAWRSAARESEKLHAASQPPLLQRRGYPHDFYCMDQARDYLRIRRNQPRGVGGRWVRRLGVKHTILGFSCGYFIVEERRKRRRIILAHPLTGAIVDGVEFPQLPRYIGNVMLTAPPTLPGSCVLSFVDIIGSPIQVTLYYCRLGASQWEAHEIRVDVPDHHYYLRNQRYVTVLDGRIHVVTKKEVVMIDLQVPKPRVTTLQTEGGLTSWSPGVSTHIVGCGGELWVVDGLETERLTVHRFEASERRWVQENDLLRGHAIAIDDADFGCSLSWKRPSHAWGGGDNGESCVYYWNLDGTVFVYHLVQGQLELQRQVEAPPGWKSLWIVPSLFA